MKVINWLWRLLYWRLCYSNHYSIQLYGKIGLVRIKAGITYKKSFVMCASKLPGALLLKPLKYFEVRYVKHFWIFPRERSWLVYVNEFSWIMFLDRDNKTNLVPVSFPCFLEEKKNFRLKSVIAITVIISLHYKETN